MASIQPYCYGYGCHDGACDDVGSVPVGRHRRELSDDAIFFATVIPGVRLLWVFFQHQVSWPEKVCRRVEVRFSFS
jgi:hypothetical protein